MRDMDQDKKIFHRDMTFEEWAIQQDKNNMKFEVIRYVHDKYPDSKLEKIEDKYNFWKRSYTDKLFKNLADKFHMDIKDFSAKYGDSFIRSDLKDKDKSWKTLRMLHNIICNYIIERYHLVIKVGDLQTPYCKKESDINKWFIENHSHLGLDKSERHQGSLDYDCRYKGIKYDRYLSYIHGSLYIDFIHDRFISVELEYLSSHFISHRHPIDTVDMIICYKKDKDIYYNIPKGEKIPILELSHMEV